MVANRELSKPTHGRAVLITQSPGFCLRRLSLADSYIVIAHLPNGAV
jgi:hypothetical protein